MKQLIECVPNISEGRDKNIIDQVTAEIEKVELSSPSWVSPSLCLKPPTAW